MLYVGHMHHCPDLHPGAKCFPDSELNSSVVTYLCTITVLNINISTTFLCLFYPELIDFTTTVIYSSMGSFPLKIFASSVILK